MDREAIRTAVGEWLDSVVEHNPQFGWLKDAQLDVQPAFLVDHQTKEGDDYRAGAVAVVVNQEERPTDGQIRQFHDLIVGDRTLGNRAKDVRFEYSNEERVVGRLVVIPR
jgi:hypothetical protein